jgi:hypothetical protein
LPVFKRRHSHVRKFTSSTLLDDGGGDDDSGEDEFSKFSTPHRRRRRRRSKKPSLKTFLFIFQTFLIKATEEPRLFVFSH